MDGANNTNNRFLSRTHYILQPAAGPPPPNTPSHNNYKLMKMGGRNNQFQTPVFDQTKTQEVEGCIYGYNSFLSWFTNDHHNIPNLKTENSLASNDHGMGICTACRQLSASVIVPNFGCPLID